MSYGVLHATPAPETYMHLRSKTLSPKTLTASKIGLANSLFSVQILVPDATIPSSKDEYPRQQDVVGMGRVTGDGGCFFEVVDICVLPEHQGKGLGKKIMTEIKQWLDENVPQTGFVSLFADGQAKDLYAQYGFKPYQLGIGMAMEY
ncbi:MAG: hypothetical protein Q9217_001273 [Psora testacea]